MPSSIPETPSSVGLKETLIDTTKGAVYLAAVALDVAGSATQQVPYLGAISKALTEVLKIVDEVDACKSAWKNVATKIQKIQTVVDDFRSQCVSEGVANEELPEMIKAAFKEFESCLLNVIKSMNDCKPASERFVDRARLVYDRSKLKAAAEQCGKDVDSALSIFEAKLQIDLFRTIHDLRNALKPHATLLSNLNSTSTTVLPPSPSIFYGRAVEVAHVVDLVLNNSPARVAIVGSGGIGKTSIALTSMHDPDVEKYYLRQRYFLSCEALATADSLTLALLKLFGLTADSSGSRSPTDILVSYVRTNTSKCLLCLDNFETPWDSERDQVEHLLVQLAVPHLSVIITSRNSDRPRGLKWTAPLLPPIQPLTVAAAVETWDAICHSHNDFSVLLINAVDCIPLAVTLLAQLAETESSEALWASWETESTKLVKSDGSAHRLNNLELSIELSLHGPRMCACPGAVDFFTILCMLPQGLPESRVTDFETSFSSCFDSTRSAIRVLKQCSLAYALNGFLRVLSPVRQYIQSCSDLATTLSTTLFTQTAELYFNLIPMGEPATTPIAMLKDIQLEIGNITAVLDICLTKYDDVSGVLDKVIRFSDTCYSLGIYDTILISRAATVAHNHGLQSVEGICYRKHGKINFSMNENSNAEVMMKSALKLHKDLNDKPAQAYDLLSLGQLYRDLFRKEEAEQALQLACRLHTEADDKHGQASDLRMLGELYTVLYRHKEAEEALQSARSLDAEVNDKLGQGIDLQLLGELYTNLGQHDEAEKSLKSALDLDTMANYKLGEAHCWQGLGQLYAKLNRLEEAENFLKSALKLYTQINAKLSQANNFQSLGELYMKLNRLKEAEQAFRSAFDLDTEGNDRLGQANVLRQLGVLYTRLNQFSDAEHALKSALSLHTDIDAKVNQANDQRELGELYTKINRLEEAEHAHQNSLNLYIEADSSLGQGNALGQLGHLCIRQFKFIEAKEFLDMALEKYEQAHSSSGQQYIERLFKLLQKKRSQII